MATSSSPSSPPPRRWAWRLGWLLLTLYFVTPPREAYDQSLDKSNYATYAHFFAQGAQWGTEVIPMTGPYGFILYGHTYSGEAFWSRLLGDLLLKAVFAGLVLHLFRRAGPGALRCLWLAAVVLMIPVVDDLFHDYAILVGGLVMIAGLGERPRRWSWLAAVLLGFLALFKGTHLITSAVVLGAVVLLAFLQRRPRAVLPLVGIYLGSVLSFWVLARQNPLHLPAYLRNVLDLSSGYNATMGLDELPVVFGAGVLLAASLGLLLAATAWQCRRNLRALVTVLLLAGFSFIKWKHGFLRADGHVYIFFTSAAVIFATAGLGGFTALLGPAPAPLTGAARRCFAALAAVVGGLAFIGTDVIGAGLIGEGPFWPQSIVTLPLRVPGQLLTNARYLANAHRMRAGLERDLDRIRRDAAVPLMQREIERDRVDFFGFEQGLILLNNLNYRPRPMGGGAFNVFTPRLQEINGAFMRDPARAPLWEIVKLASVDGRLPAADDPLTLLAILRLYTPVLMQRDYILFRRLPEETPWVEPRALATVSVRAGETIKVPEPGPDQLVLFTVEAPLSLGGWLRSFLYRPPNLSIRVTTDYLPRGHNYLVRPLMLQRPVILSPLLEDNADLLRLYDNVNGDRVRTLRLDPAPGYAPEPFRVHFFTVPRPPPSTECDIKELLTYRRHPLYNRPPVSLVTQETGIRELNPEEPITLVHAPGSITWDLRPDDQQVIFSYGIYPKAYLEGTTDGVEFNVEVIWPPADGRVLWKQMLSPRVFPPDRGMHWTRVYLPPYRPGAQLRIRTHPGPANDGAFDQSYVTRVQIKTGLPHPEGDASSTLIPEQFNGLGVVPANGLLPSTSVAAIGGRPVFLLHAPDEVILNVPAASRRLTAEIGLLPGAYTGEGHSDGVEFTVSLLAPNGDRTPLWKRYLDPVRVPGDRGPQAIAVTLPKLPPGTQLVIATGVGPHGDRSWDHSYIAGVKFR